MGVKDAHREAISALQNKKAVASAKSRFEETPSVTASEVKRRRRSSETGQRASVFTVDCPPLPFFVMRTMVPPPAREGHDAEEPNGAIQFDVGGVLRSIMAVIQVVSGRKERPDQPGKAPPLQASARPTTELSAEAEKKPEEKAKEEMKNCVESDISEAADEESGDEEGILPASEAVQIARSKGMPPASSSSYDDDDEAVSNTSSRLNRREIGVGTSPLPSEQRANASTEQGGNWDDNQSEKEDQEEKEDSDAITQKPGSLDEDGAEEDKENGGVGAKIGKELEELMDAFVTSAADSSVSNVERKVAEMRQNGKAEEELLTAVGDDIETSPMESRLSKLVDASPS